MKEGESLFRGNHGIARMVASLLEKYGQDVYRAMEEALEIYAEKRALTRFRCEELAKKEADGLVGTPRQRTREKLHDQIIDEDIAERVVESLEMCAKLWGSNTPLRARGIRLVE